MEFTKLSEVEVVETANDTDKVLIEQNGEIKRVPKTEVGGGAGGMLVIDCVVDVENGTVEATPNMTLDEALEALTNRTLTGAVLWAAATGMTQLTNIAVIDYTAQAGEPTIVLMNEMTGEMLWTAAGIQVDM